MAEIIKMKIAEREDIAGENVYSFNLPDESSHQNHITGMTAAVMETIDPNVRSKIKELVGKGKRNVSVIAALMEQYVINELGETNKLRSRFYPQRSLIRNIVNTEKRQIRWSKIDLENTEKLVEDWKKKSEGVSSIYFRPCRVQNNSSEVCNQQEESDDESEEDNQTLKWKQTPNGHLLFVYQSQEMRHLYRRYGKDGILLDATYKTCKWALPLYFLAVKTNVGYQPVAVIITQYETQQAIVEALSIIKQWNSEVAPKYGMVDFAMEEILALETVFTDIQVFICTFHREQAWTRWFSKATNSGIPRTEALKKLRAIANAPTEEKLQEAVEDLKKWSHYEESQLKFYFERTWLPHVKRWTVANKPPGLLFHTNNGVERINEELKYRYLIENKNCSLSEMMNIVVTDFLPDRYKSYVSQNICMLNNHKKYEESVPDFLHNRPKCVVDSVKKMLDFLDSENTDQISIKKLSENSYEVPSLTSKNVSYEVHCKDTPTCTCEAFIRNRVFCKHMILISKKFPEFDIGTLILNNEVFRVDETVVNIQKMPISVTATSMENEELNSLPFSPSVQKYGELTKRKSKKNKLISECNSKIRSMQSAMWLLEEDYLETFKDKLQNLYEEAISHVTMDHDTALPISTPGSSKRKKKSTSQYAELPKPPRKKAKRFGHAADVKENEMHSFKTMIDPKNVCNPKRSGAADSNLTD